MFVSPQSSYFSYSGAPFNMAEGDDLGSLSPSISDCLTEDKDIQELLQLYKVPGRDWISDDRGWPQDSQECSYRSVPVQEWQGEQCKEWAEDVLRRCLSTQGSAALTPDLWPFQTVTGLELLQYNAEDFCRLAGQDYGGLFLKDFQKIKRRSMAQGAGMQHENDDTSLHYPSHYPDYHEEWPSQHGNLEGYHHSSEYRGMMPNEGAISAPGASYYPDYSAGTTSDRRGTYQAIDGLESGMQSLGWDNPGTGSGGDLDSESPSTTEENSPSVTDSSIFQRIPSKRRPRDRGIRSWEFVYMLLNNKDYNPSVIRWEDINTATFRLVQPQVIATMWGERDGKPDLTYVNFARSLRYHYRSGVLQAVSEKQLVYRFGPPAFERLKASFEKLKKSPK